MSAGGGGGFGAPHERDPAIVASDVRQGYVSAESARDNYLVALSPDFSVDKEKTRSMRESVRYHEI